MNNIWNYSIGVRAALLAIAGLTLGTAESAVRFEENLGQTSKQVRYLARAGGKTFYFGDRQLYIELWGAVESSSVVRMSFTGSDSKARWQASGAHPEPISYFVGRDQTRWVRGARQFSQLEWKGLYPGIDAVFHGDGASMEYDLVLAKGADPASVRLRFEGDGRARMAADGAIEIVTPAGSLWQRAPRIYQESAKGARIPVSGRFVAGAGKRDFTLQLGAYDRALPLVVDPVLEFSTYLGGDNEDQVKAVGDGFVAGTTRSVAFPGAPAARRRSRNIFLKGTPLSGSFSYGFYGTFVIGGSGDDDLTAAVVANAFSRPAYYLAGATSSRDFPIGNHIPTTYGGGATDGFLVRLEGGQFYQYDAQYIGGSGEDRITALASSDGGVVGVGITDSPDLPVKNAFQPALAGGKDAFVFTMPTYSSDILTLTYLGGSGDDAAYAVAITSAGFVVGGETQSPDFPLTGWPSGGRNGPSDGFLALLSGGFYSVPFLNGSMLIGGSGEDRVQGLAVPTGYYYYNASPFVAVTGTTTSPDFPVVNPVQDHFGGASDAFLLRLNTRDGTLPFSTLLGGSDTEEGTAVAMDTQGDIAVAGVTRSTNLPVFQALQPNPAGGEDGFFGWFDVNNHLQQLTYFGGSGDDHIYSVVFAGASARIVGSTTSTDLPLKNPSQDTKDDGMDGFIADIGTDFIIGPDRLSIGKDMAVYLSLSAARNYSKIALKLVSSDPSKVRFTQNGQTSGEVTLNAPWNTTIEALTDSGQVDITATADGLPPRTISVTLLPTAIQLYPPSFTFTTWSRPQNISYYVVAWNPATNQVEGYGVLRDGVPPLRTAWSSSDETVVRVQDNGNPYAEPVGPGSAQLTLTSATLPVVPPGSISVTVVRPDILPFNMTLGKDLQTNLQFAITQDGKTTLYYLSPKGTITFRSSDPSRLLLSLDPGKSGQESVTVDTKTSQAIPMLWAQALGGDGDVKVLISSTEILADREITVTLRPTTVTLTSDFGSGAVTANVGNTVHLFPRIGFIGSPPYPGYSLRPGVTLHYTYSTSDPKVVTVSPTSSDSTSTVYPVAMAVGNGTAELRLTVDDPAIQVTPLSVTVQPMTAFVPASPQIYVGKDLRTSTSLSFRLPANSEATVTVADPSLALVSADGLTAGQAEIRKQFSNDLTFWVYGLAAAGQTAIRVQVNGIVVNGTVTLAPSGFAFSTSSVTSAFYSKGSLILSAYALDIPTGIPLYAQQLRPGVLANLLLQQDSTAISLNPATIAFSSDTGVTGAAAAYTVNALGETNVWFDAPAGFTAPSRRTRVKIHTVPAGIGIDRAPIAANHATLAFGVGVRTDNGLQAPVTITATSGDPTKLLVLSTTGEAASSATIPTPGLLLLVGLADTGAVTLHLTGPNLEPLDVLVPLYPLRVSIGSPFGGSLSSGVSLLTQTAGSALYATLDVGGFGNLNLSLRPEASPLRVEFNSTDPTVATVDPPFVEFTPAHNSVSFVIKPVSPGNAEILIQSPSGLAVNPSSITVSVRAPKFLLPKVVLGKDMQGAVTVSAEYGGAPQDNKILKLTSLSPDRLLLSRSADVRGSASLTLAYQANASQSQPIYLQALAGDGEATIRISADGYADSDSTVVLVASALVLNVNSFTFELGNGTTGTIFMQASPDAIPAGVQPPYDVKVRAGGPRITAPLAIADPSVASVDPAQVTFAPGDAAQPFTLKPGSAPGTTSLTVGVPDGFADPGPARRTAAVQVTLRTLNLNCNDTEIGKDAQVQCSVSLPANVTATAVSSQPSSLLVSFDSKATGSAALAAVSPPVLYLQALTDNGNVEVLLSAPGYRDAKVTFHLRPSAFVFLDSTVSLPSIPLKVGNTRDVDIQFRRFQASGELWYYLSTLRPSAGPIRLDVSSTNPGVVRVPPDAVTFAPGDGSKTIRLTAVAPGSATVRVPAPPGFAAAPRDQAVYIVQP
jgi:hypothetical protein